MLCTQVYSSPTPYLISASVNAPLQGVAVGSIPISMHDLDQVDLVSVVCDENPEVIEVDHPVSHGTGDIRNDDDNGAFSPH